MLFLRVVRISLILALGGRYGYMGLKRVAMGGFCSFLKLDPGDGYAAGNWPEFLSGPAAGTVWRIGELG